MLNCEPFLFLKDTYQINLMKNGILLILTVLFSLNIQAQDFRVPKRLKLEKAEDYAKYEDDVLKAVKWLKNTPVHEQKSKRKEVGAFLMKWITGAPDLTLTIDLKVCPYAEDPDCFLMFMAGWTEYALSKKDDSASEGAYAGTIAVLDFYEKNKYELGKVKGIKKLIKKRKKGKLKAHIEKLTKNY